MDINDSNKELKKQLFEAEYKLKNAEKQLAEYKVNCTLCACLPFSESSYLEYLLNGITIMGCKLYEFVYGQEIRIGYSVPSEGRVHIENNLHNGTISEARFLNSSFFFFYSCN